MVLLVSWLILAIIIIIFGKLCDNKILLGIGAIMVIMTAMISDVSY